MMLSIFIPAIPPRDIFNKISFVMLLLFISFYPYASAAEGGSEVLSLTANESDQSTEIRIKCSGMVTSTVYELPGPDRIVVDIADAVFSKDFKNLMSPGSIKIQTKDITDARPNIVRIEVVLNEKTSYESKKENFDIVLNIKKNTITADSPKENLVSGNLSQQKKETVASNNDKVAGIISSSKAIDKQLPEINPLENKISQKAKEQQLQDTFNFSGYNKERISVEFQKMDLHNVFNFLRQVSGVNIVVDESVQGSLTLMLDNVPWDFALDIILNLKDLEKEDRFNTLVIYPKKKEFKWPEQGKNNLSFQADSKIVAQEALVIRQQEKHPVESTEAKQEIALGKEAEKQENFEMAVGYYEKALEKWPSNSNLANKIASIYLVQLRQNAKSMYYSKMALEKDSKNTSASLNAAIASANMQDKQKAVFYFNHCTQVKKPAKEALISYAAFSEEQHEYDNALKILEKHSSLYGEDLDAMIAEARIYDKMGKKQQATEKYKKIALSGYNVPPDLDKYIKGRIAFNQSM